MLLAIDPGLRGCGVAGLDEKTGRVLFGRYVVNPGPKTLRGPMAWRYMAEELPKQLYTVEASTVVVEQQQVYRLGHGKIGDPADLLELAGVVGAVAVVFSKLPVIGVLPRLWKGQVDADVMTRRIQARLTPSELDAISVPRESLLHNTIDAVGLGLWWLERNGVCREKR